MPAQVWVWITQVDVGLGHVDGAMDHEAGAVDAVVEAGPKSGLARMLPSWSILSRLEAVISS